ncbi:PQQ-binding-like beta-propeller repeat protein [Spirosoma aerophilum]
MAMCIIPLLRISLGLISLISSTILSSAQSRQSVFISSDNGVLYALDANHGRLKWQYTFDKTRIEAAPIASDGLVIVGTSSEAGVYAFDEQTGALKWKQRLPDGLIFSARIANKTVYALASHKAFWDHSGKNYTTLYALDMGTGTLKWSFQAGDQIYRAALSNADENCPLVCGGTVYFGANDGQLYAVDSQSGSKKWSYQSGFPFYSSPVWIDGTVYAGDANGSLLAIDDSTGKLNWKIHDAYTIHAGISTDRKLLFVPYDGPASLVAYSPADGSRRWQFSPNSFIASASTIANGLLYTSSEEGTFYALDCTNGGLKWKVNLFATRITTPTIVNNIIYLGGGNRMYALDADTGKQKWTFSMKGNIVKSACVQLADGTIFRGLGAVHPDK